MKRTFPQKLALLDGLGPTKHAKLISAGITTIETLENSTGDELLSIKGIGANTVKRLMEFIPEYRRYQNEEAIMCRLCRATGNICPR